MQRFTRAVALLRSTPARCSPTIPISRSAPARISIPTSAAAIAITRPVYGRRHYTTPAPTATSTPTATTTSNPKMLLQAPEHLNPKETEIFERLVGELEPVELDVQDISGGCGSMYGIQITSEKFRGLNMLKQQRLVNAVLGDEIKSWHGVQLRTKVP